MTKYARDRWLKECSEWDRDQAKKAWREQNEARERMGDFFPRLCTDQNSWQKEADKFHEWVSAERAIEPLTDKVQ
jgi:hypothetical protein